MGSTEPLIHDLATIMEYARRKGHVAFQDIVTMAGDNTPEVLLLA